MRRLFAMLSLYFALAGIANAQDPLLGRTVMLHDANQGTQVIYLGRAGRTYLWHPSSQQVISGRWRVEASGGYPDTICIGYGANRYNPVTGLQYGNTHCTKVQELLAKTYEQVDGDLFALSSRTDAPAQLGASKTTLGVLADRAGVAVTGPVIGKAGIIRPGGPAPTMNDFCETAALHQQMFGAEDGTTRMLELCGTK